MWSESGNGIDVGPLGALETWHEKGEAPKNMLAQSKSYAGKEFLVCAYPRWLHTWAVMRARQVALFVNKFRWKFDTNKIL